jgi:CRP-like cAMP-binding protein
MKTQFRKHLEQITSLSEDEFEYVFSIFKSKFAKKHQLLIQEGDAVKNEYWVASGCLKAYNTTEDGKIKIIRFAMENWWISDYQAYLTQGTATLTIQCLEDCELLVLSYSDREELCRKIPKMERFFRKKIEGGYISFQQRLISMLSENAATRFAVFQQQYPSLVQRIPKKLIASYLGVSRETLSRIEQKV